MIWVCNDDMDMEPEEDKPQQGGGDGGAWLQMLRWVSHPSQVVVSLVPLVSMKYTSTNTLFSLLHLRLDSIDERQQQQTEDHAKMLNQQDEFDRWQ